MGWKSPALEKWPRKPVCCRQLSSRRERGTLGSADTVFSFLNLPIRVLRENLSLSGHGMGVGQMCFTP